MALTIPTTEETKDTNIANLESSLNQDTPPNDKAYNKVISGVEALNITGLYKYGAERAKQNLALTATGQDLEDIGAEYGVNRNQAEATVLTVDIVAEDGTVVPAGFPLTGQSNGIRYFTDSSTTAASGVASPSITASVAGAVGGLDVGATLSLGREIPGAASTATVTSVDNTGADIEDQEAYRERVLFAIRSTPGAGNTTDYKRWSEKVSGVQRAYPYAGRNFGSPSSTNPGERTVFIEATSDVQIDGIAPQSLLDEVREAINFNPDTGAAQAPLGLEDDTMDVLSITRSSFNVTITGLVVDSTLEAQAKADIETALDLYLRGTRPYIEGVDILSERNDTISKLTVSTTVQSVLDPLGGSAQDVTIELVGAGIFELYTLQPGELAKLAGVAYD